MQKQQKHEKKEKKKERKKERKREKRRRRNGDASSSRPKPCQTQVVAQPKPRQT